MRCRRCGNISPVSTAVFCDQCGAMFLSGNTGTHTRIPNDHIAWETDLRRTATFQTLFMTLFEVIMHPDRFFKKTAAKKCSAVPSWIYGLAVGSLGVLFAWFWSTLFNKYGKDATYAYEFFSLAGEVPLPWILIGAPFILTFQFALAAAYVKIAMSFSRLEKAEFSQIFRILCYAESPMALQLIPLIGAFAGLLLWLYDVLTGLRYLYAASRLRIFFLLLLPFFILTAIVLIIIIAVVLGGILAGTEFLQSGGHFFDWLK